MAKTGSSAKIFGILFLNSPTLQSLVIFPPGKRQTNLPLLRSLDICSNTCAKALGSSLVLDVGMTLCCLRNGFRKRFHRSIFPWQIGGCRAMFSKGKCVNITDMVWG